MERFKEEKGRNDEKEFQERDLQEGDLKNLKRKLRCIICNFFEVFRIF